MSDGNAFRVFSYLLLSSSLCVDQKNFVISEDEEEERARMQLEQEKRQEQMEEEDEEEYVAIESSRDSMASSSALGQSCFVLITRDHCPTKICAIRSQNRPLAFSLIFW